MADLPEEKHTDDEAIKRSVLESLDALDRRGKLQVLDFIRELAAGSEAPRLRDTRKALLALTGTIPKEDLDEMEKVIEEEFGKIDKEGW